MKSSAASVADTRALRLPVLLLVFAAVAGGVFLAMLVVVTNSPDVPLDASVGTAADEWRSPALTAWAVPLTALGAMPVLLVAAGVVTWLSEHTTRTPVFGYLLVVVLGAAAASWAVKLLVARQRPTVGALVTSAGFAFPSGHSTQVAAAAFGLAVVVLPLLAGRAGRALFLALLTVAVVVVGATRVYLRVHHTTDVLGGWALGLSWAAFVTALSRQWSRFDLRPIPDRGADPDE